MNAIIPSDAISSDRGKLLRRVVFHVQFSVVLEVGNRTTVRVLSEFT
jgi:hypothetical protein